MNSSPLFFERPAGVWLTGPVRSYTQQEFCARVMSLADALPDKPYMIILAQQRSDFMLCFCAAMLRGQTVLLASNATAGAAAEVAASYPGCYALSDAPVKLAVANFVIADFPVDSSAASNCQPGLLPLIPGGHVAAILQTSGSAGKPKSHAKTWGELVAGARRLAQRLMLTPEDCIVSTVPAQHMYGLETSILLPLQSGAALYDGQPLYPGDVAAAVTGAAGAPVLVTTPLHLSACIREAVDWPPVKRVVCSTARLDPLIAEQSGELLQAEITELYGSTETGAVATRQAPDDQQWKCLDGLELYVDHSNTMGVRLVDTESEKTVPVTDKLELIDAGHFHLLGRPTDMLKIAGKRMSLADLNIRLNRIAGVRDGAILVRDQSPGIRRLIALVVRDADEEPQIRFELAKQVDPVFLPRKIYYVDELPRSAIGKLTERALMSLLKSLDGK